MKPAPEGIGRDYPEEDKHQVYVFSLVPANFNYPKNSQAVDAQVSEGLRFKSGPAGQIPRGEIKYPGG